MKAIRQNIFIFITLCYLLVNIPYMINRFWSVFNIYITTAAFLVSIVIYYLMKEGGKQLPPKFNRALIVTIVAWLLFAIIHDDFSYITRVILLIITYLFLLALYRNDSFLRFWKYNNYFILIQAVLSLIAFVLVGAGVIKPLASISISDGSYSRSIYFWGLCFSKTFIGNLIRPSGFFDEPGALAAWSVYSLMLNYAFIKDRILSRVLPFCAVSTLSVAYVIQMGCFYAMAYVRKIHYLAFVGILIMTSIYVIEFTRNTNFDVYEKTIARFEYSSESVIEGNNREIHMENAKRYFLQSPMVGVGGQTLGEAEDLVSDNPYEILAKDGIIGYIISYLPLIFILFTNRRKEVIVCVAIVFIGYLQRPLHINFMHDMYIWSFLLFALLDARSRKYKKIHSKLS